MTIKFNVEERLKSLLGDRVRFDELECKLYSHDVGDIPRLVKPFIPSGRAGAVTRPRDERELKEILKIAADEGIPVVARGAATSGYGGVLPAPGAIVIEMLNFSTIKSIDVQHRTVTVGASTVWEKVEEAVGKEGLMLATYPSSAPSSTVGGWLAQGGYGYGAFQYGSFLNTVKSARVMKLDGEVEEFSGEDLRLIYEAEGTTGIILDVTIELRTLEEFFVKLVSFPSAKSLMHALEKISEGGLRMWSISFINPTSVEMRQQLPPKLWHGHPVAATGLVLPKAYIATVAFPVSCKDCEEELVRAIESSQGEILSDELAKHEWEERFDTIKIKRIAPSLIPAEVIIPVEQFDAFMAAIDQKVKQRFVLEGLLTKNGEIVILGFIPHDQRKLSYNLAFGLAVTVIEMAKKLGGRAYSTGQYFKSEAKSVLGEARVTKLKEYKKVVDPKNILNPGKIIGSDSFTSLLSFAASIEPVVRRLGNLAKASIGERFKPANGLPGDVLWYAYACAQCGYCVRTCDQFYGRGWESESPRGKWFYLREVAEGRERFEQDDVNRILACTTCEECNVRCQLDLPNESSWMKLRGQLINQENRMTFPPFEMMAAALRHEKNIWAQMHDKRADWVPAEIKPKVKDKAQTAYFAGCTASFVETDIAKGTLQLLDKVGVEFTLLGEEENCCGIPMLVSGRWDVFEEILRHNIAKMKEKGVKTIVTSCPACWLSWHTFYPDWAEKLGIDFPFKTKHYSEIMVDKLKAGEFKFEVPVNSKVTFHDSCHIGRAGGIYEPPRELIKAVPGTELVEMAHNREEGLCCGSVLSLVADPAVAAEIGEVRIQEAVDAGVDQILALCPCCQVQMRVTNKKKQMNMPVNDLASYLAKGLGIEIPNSSDYALEMWAVFERFIYLMKNENMAELMGILLPDMMAAMPRPLRSMMKAMKYIPGWESMVKALMPIMMPRLVPILLPKVMHQMLVEVERRAGPIPPDMLKLMPELLPKTMDALMPNMLPMLIPMITPKMIECIKDPKCIDNKSET